MERPRRPLSPAAANASLIVTASRDKRVWMYDDESRNVWRRLDGSRGPLATRA